MISTAGFGCAHRPPFTGDRHKKNHLDHAWYGEVLTANFVYAVVREPDCLAPRFHSSVGRVSRSGQSLTQDRADLHGVGSAKLTPKDFNSVQPTSHPGCGLGAALEIRGTTSGYTSIQIVARGILSIDLPVDRRHPPNPQCNPILNDPVFFQATRDQLLFSALEMGRSFSLLPEDGFDLAVTSGSTCHSGLQTSVASEASYRSS
jgi:hypothetical protein